MFECTHEVPWLSAKPCSQICLAWWYLCLSMIRPEFCSYASHANIFISGGILRGSLMLRHNQYTAFGQKLPSSAFTKPFAWFMFFQKLLAHKDRCRRRIVGTLTRYMKSTCHICLAEVGIQLNGICTKSCTTTHVCLFTDGVFFVFCGAQHV